MSAEVNQTRPISIDGDDGIVGQRSVVDLVKVGLAAAAADSSKFPHSLLVGGPGLGKSLTAAVIAKEMGTEMIETLAQTVTTPAEMHALLLGAADRDVILLDECHELAYPMQTILYRAIDERLIYLQPESSKYKPKSVPLADFTLLLASTDEHALLEPLRDRMRLVLRFDFYDEAELTELVAQRASMLGWNTEPEVVQMIANLGRGTPRIALRLLESAWRVARSEGKQRISARHFVRCCELQGLDERGLDAVERKYLQLLYEAPGALRLNVIATTLGLPSRTVAQVVEGYLLRAGLICREELGRRLTVEGWNYIYAQVDPVGFRRTKRGRNGAND